MPPPTTDERHGRRDRSRRRRGARLAARDDVGGAVPDFSGTNTQEADVDEPDVIKTDGRRIFAVTDARCG